MGNFFSVGNSSANRAVADGGRLSPQQKFEQLKAKLDQWVDMLPRETGEERVIAASRILQAYTRQGEKLDLARLGLKFLPEGVLSELNIKELHLEANQFESLSENAFAGLSNLRILNLSGNKLRYLPEKIFIDLDNLQDLNLRGNGLGNDACTGFLAGTKNLHNVILSFNQLSTLPENICSEWSHLHALDLEGNELTSLPNDILALPNGSRVYLDNNPLSPRIRTRLRECTRVPHYQGPQFFFSMAVKEQGYTDIPLEKIVKSWFDKLAFPFSSESESAWQAINDEVMAQSFAQFLKRLIENNVNNSVKSFSVDIVNRLSRLEKNKDLRDLIFPIAKEGLGSCEDRITFALNEMQQAEMVFDVECGKYDTSLKKLILLARQQFRLNALANIAAEKVKNLNFVDVIEVYLGYQVKLRESLGLDMGTEKMCYFDPDSITKQDLKLADFRVKQEENKNFKRYFAAWEPWHSVLKRKVPEVYQQLQDAIYTASEEYYAEQATMQCKAGTFADTEANRLKVEEAVTRSLALLKSEYQVKATEKLLEKQNALLSELNRQVWQLEQSH